ncbi:hypothetical protein CJ030_MR5G022420 [Morella rubra]|uniref:Uncharacterized protein n=1 Tax=Morella rubra TaxID=262757 RepID=A0A6A1VK41_9ROSI|nr:hypothetical protein CJ030_MR5G022420 [Morella rubra]
MSSSRSKRPAHQTPTSVSSRTRKKGKSTEEPAPTPEAAFTGMSVFVNLKVDCYVYLVKLVYANFQYSTSDDANSYVNGKQLDMSVASLNALASAPNDGKKFFDAYGWSGMSKVEPIDILRVVLDNPTLSEVIRPTAREVREKSKESKEYNKKTLRLMGFMQNEDEEWVRKGVVTPQKGREGGSDSEEESEDEEEEATARTPMGT